MTESRLSLQMLNVPSPCAVPWRFMKGNEQVRFCSQCQKSVYNLSAISNEQAHTLLADHSGSLCVRYYYRADGTVVNAERCNNRVARVWQRVASTIGTALIALLSLTGCDNCRFGCTQGKLTTPPGRPRSVSSEEQPQPSQAR